MATYIVVFLIGGCIGGLGISFFSSKSYDKGFEDAKQLYKDIFGGGKNVD